MAKVKVLESDARKRRKSLSFDPLELFSGSSCENTDDEESTDITDTDTSNDSSFNFSDTEQKLTDLFHREFQLPKFR